MEEHLRTAFSALTRQTRALVILELDAAIRDTAVEYHRSENDVAQLLWAEIQQLQCVRNLAKEIVEEFDELSRLNDIREPQEDRHSTDSLKPLED